MRKIMVVEGTEATGDTRRAVDSRIYAFLNDRFGQTNIIAGGGKSEAIALVGRLNEVLGQVSTGLTAKALLDRDLQTSAANEDVILLPVSMVENLLLDPVVIWEALAIVRHKTSLTGIAEVTAEPDKILDEAEAHEVERRVKGAVPAKTFRLKNPTTDALQQVEEFVAELKSELSPARVGQLQANAQQAVAKLKQDKKRREYFDGKYILNEFYRRHLHSTGMSKEIFVYNCAREASKRNSVRSHKRIKRNIRNIRKEGCGPAAVRPSARLSGGGDAGYASVSP